FLCSNYGHPISSPEHGVRCEINTHNVFFYSEGQKAFAFGKDALKEKLALDEIIATSSEKLPVDSPAAKHQKGFQKTNPLSSILAKQGHIAEKATQKFKNSFKLADDVSGLLVMPNMSVNLCDDASLQRPAHFPCLFNERYRRIDGTCNNLQNPLWGASFIPFRRAILPEYGDGISSLRVAASGLPLPSARLVSTSVNIKPNVESSSFTILHMVYGQFVDHDLTSTPVSQLSNSIYGDVSVKCCQTELETDTCNGRFSQRGLKEQRSAETKRQFTIFSPECAAIDISHDDDFYCTFGQTCMEFVRSAPAARCTFGPREQTNQLTAYLDGSVIYGSFPDTSLRTYSQGLLSTQLIKEGVELLPPSTDPDDGCNVPERSSQNQFCFLAGDERVNEQRLLTLFQTVWAREHNRIARELGNLNPGWNDETVFQETRRIVVAEFQQITYGEYLPTILGPWLSSQLDLLPLNGGQFTSDYDPNINVGIANSFATAAYRFGHSEIADGLKKLTSTGTGNTDPMTSVFFNPFELYMGDAMSDLARGSLSQAARHVDSSFTEQITNFLFKGQGNFGLDLIALNIQRGRDHGLPGYNTYRDLCQLPVATSFNDLAADIDSDNLQNLESVYSHVDDIDLFIGGLSERPLTGGLLGPTLTCIITDQFYRIKRGDRYWFESRDMPGGSFKNNQMAHLHKVTLGRLLCDNIPELLEIQQQPLRQVSSTNVKKSCSDKSAFPSLNFNLWRVS
ncbi:hypothetical protein SK128_008779, partial [Halocaridina rubra]